MTNNNETIPALTKYPEQLVNDRRITEANFIFSMWKDPELYGDMGKEIKPTEDILTPDGVFYYSLGKELFDKDYQSFDEVTIFTHLQDNPILLEGFNRRGGIRTVNEIRDILDINNAESYYDNLLKSNMLMKLYDKGFDVLTEINKFKKMNTTQLYDYFEYQLDNVFLNRGAGVKIEDFVLDDQFLQDCHDGIEKGLSYASAAPILNYHTLGLHKSNVQIFGGFSGTGKSSFVVAAYMMSILEQGEKITIIANEMNIKAWKHIYLATVLSSRLKYYGLTRKKQKTGNFNEEHWKMLKEAQRWSNENHGSQIKFVKIYDYSIEDVKRVIRKQSKLGFKYTIFDTFKSENNASANVTGELIEASKQLLQVAEKEDVCIIITMQLAIHMEGTRYLTSQTLSNAKGVKEVVSEVVLMRKVWEDEYSGEKYDIKPYRLAKDPITNKITSVREYITINPDKKYRIMFLDKTRNDEDDMCILFQFDGAWNQWREIGYCTPSHQNRI